MTLDGAGSCRDSRRVESGGVRASVGKRGENMKLIRSSMLAGLALALAACGTTPGDRAATGAIIGAGTGGVIGLAFGGVGVGAGAFVGAAIGAGTGALTNDRQINLGKPVWR